MEIELLFKIFICIYIIDLWCRAFKDGFLNFIPGIKFLYNTFCFSNVQGFNTFTDPETGLRFIVTSTGHMVKRDPEYIPTQEEVEETLRKAVLDTLKSMEEVEEEEEENKENDK